MAQGLFNVMFLGGLCLVGVYSLKELSQTHHGSASLENDTSMRADWDRVRSLRNASDQKSMWVSRHHRSPLKIDVTTGRRLEEVHLPAGYLADLQLNHAGTCAFFRAPDGQLKVVRREHEDWESLPVRPTHPEDCHYALSPVAEALAIATETSLELWSLKNSLTPLVMVPLSRRVAGMEWSPDGRHLLVVTSDALLELRDGETLAVVRMAQTSVKGCAKCIWAPGGRHVAAYSFDGTITVWDLKGSDVSLQHVECPFPIVAALSHDGHWLAVPGVSREVWLINVDEPGNRYELGPLSAPASAMQFAADGTSLLVGSQDGTVQCWSLTDRQLAWISSDTEY